MAIGVSGCGDSEQTETTGRGGLDGGLAESLATKSDQVAELVDQGDECAAAHLADNIMAEVEDNSREIPERVLAELEPAVGHLQGQVSCEEPAPPPLPEPETETETQPSPTATEEEGGEDEESSEEVPGRGDERGRGRQKQEQQKDTGGKDKGGKNKGGGEGD